jgi:iron-sulfur cluster repair protein YtfE (RIC family)
MDGESLRSVLEGEHREIDAAIEPLLGGGAVSAERRQAFVRAVGALRRHIYAEEELLFPQLRAKGMVAPVLVMLREHAQMWQTLDALDRLLESAAIGDDAIPVLARQLFAQLQAHNSKEEAILYPQAELTLSADGRAQLREFLRSGQLPEDWMCQQLQV